MNNTDRRNNILDALNDKRLTGANGSVKIEVLRMWLGNPYCFDANLIDLIRDGKVIEHERTRPHSGRPYTVYTAAPSN